MYDFKAFQLIMWNEIPIGFILINVKIETYCERIWNLDVKF